MTIDTERIKQTVNLLALIERDTNLKRVASTAGGEFAGPCPFCGGKDRFRVQPERGRWFCRQCAGENWHDAIDYIMRRDGLDFQRACEVLANGDVPIFPAGETTGHHTAVDEPDIGLEPPSAMWQAAARVIVQKSAENLRRGSWWFEKNGLEPDSADLPTDTPPEARAYGWLRRRGLSRDTIWRFQLGFNPDWVEVLPEHKLAPGVTIPNLVGNELWYVNVRLTRPWSRRLGDKYRSLKGSTLASLYLADQVQEHRYGIAVEGEFDALLLHQEAGDLVAVCTMGGANVIPQRWAITFGHIARGNMFVVLDQDAAGNEGTAKWLQVGAVPVSAELAGPGLGQDITDYHLASGDLRAWVTRILANTADGRRILELERLIVELSAEDPEWGYALAEYDLIYSQINRDRWSCLT